MFNLDEAIANWRRQMLACGFSSVEDLQELESHLRDDVAAQVRTGMNVEQAYELAVARLGAPADLKKEFAKSQLHGAAQRRKTMEYFYFICATAAVLIDLWSLLS